VYATLLSTKLISEEAMDNVVLKNLPKLYLWDSSKDTYPEILSIILMLIFKKKEGSLYWIKIMDQSEIINDFLCL